MTQKKDRRVASLATLFKGPPPDDDVSDKLVNLFQKRVELKKEFAGLRKNQYRLEDRVKIEAGNSARVQQQLDRLEQMLLNPKDAPNVLAHYQLKGLANRCHRKLAKFGEQLKQQREQKQQNQRITDWNKQRFQESRVAEKRLADLRSELMDYRAECAGAEDALASMNGLLKLFKRRSVVRLVGQLQQKMAIGQSEEESLLESIAVIQSREPPRVDGIDNASKRQLNFMIIAYAQELLLNFADAELADMARGAAEHGAGATNYGGRKECNRLIDRIENCLNTMSQTTESSEAIMRRSKLIAENAVFRNESDVVPKSASVSTVFAFREDGEVIETKADILGENYWEIASILSR